MYFLVVLPYNTLRKKGEVEQPGDTWVVLLTEIRDLLAQTNGDSLGRAVGHYRQPTQNRNSPTLDPDQISADDNCPMICAASGFSDAIPSRTA